MHRHMSLLTASQSLVLEMNIRDCDQRSLGRKESAKYKLAYFRFPTSSSTIPVATVLPSIYWLLITEKPDRGSH